MKWVKVLLMTTLSVGVLWMVGCGEESPLSPNAEEEMAAPAAKLTISANAVAGTCEHPRCRPGFYQFADDDADDDADDETDDDAADDADDETDIEASYSFTGNADDESGNGNDGTVDGPTLTTDRSGNEDSAYSFDGLDDKIEVPDSPSLDITEQISVAAWVLASSQKTQEIVRKGTDVNGPAAAPYGLSLSATGDIIFALRPDLDFTQVRRSGYPLDEWFSIVGTYDGTTMRLYVNGQLESTEAITGTLNENDLPLLIGTRLGLASDTFDGKIDDVRIYSRVLSEEEIIEYAQ